MKRPTWIGGWVCGLLLMTLAACSEDPPPPSGEASYTTCSGRRGTCISAPFASTNEYSLNSETQDDLFVDCEVQRATAETYYLDFSIQTRDGTTGLVGEWLEFRSGATKLTQLTACDLFTVIENGNEYRARVCDELDVREDSTGYGGGGCEIRLFIDSEDAIEGSFECKEIKIDGSDLYLSTIHRGGIGAGSFLLRNCRFRI